jgi:hypothetical protein
MSYKSNNDVHVYNKVQSCMYVYIYVCMYVCGKFRRTFTTNSKATPKITQ